MGPIGLIPSRQVYLDFTYPFGIGNLRLLTASPDRSPNFESPWKPFSQNVNEYKNLNSTLQLNSIGQVWIAFIVSISVLSVTMYYSWSLKKANRSTNRTTDYIIQVILAQGKEILFLKFMFN